MTEERPVKADGWTKFAVFVYYGFFFVGKYFAFFAGPLVAALAFNRTVCQRCYTALTRREPLTYLCWMLVISMMYGIWGVVYGVLSGYSPVTAIQILVFNFCPLYLFLGIWAGAQKPGILRSIVRFNAWYNAVYSVLYFAIFKNMNSDLLGQPGSGSNTLLGLFCFEPNLGPFWFPILIAVFTMIANQIRADWAGFGVALIIWAVAAKQVRRVALMAALVITLLGVGLIFDLKMPGLPGRGGDVSARDTIGRALSSFNPSLAKEFNKDADTFAGTVQWRETWWKAIRETVYESPTTAIFGMGYGYPIGDLVPYLKGSDLRTPHSIFYFTLAYSGLLGVVVFFVLQATIFQLEWLNYKATGQVFGLIFHVSIVTVAFFGNFFEAPQMAIPTYIWLGMSLGPFFVRTNLAGNIRPLSRRRRALPVVVETRIEDFLPSPVARHRVDLPE